MHGALEIFALNLLPSHAPAKTFLVDALLVNHNLDVVGVVISFDVFTVP